MIDYQITDVVDHSVMKLDVLDLISNMPSTEIETRGYFGKHKSVISNSNWDDSLTAYLVHGAGDRLVADSIVIDGKADQDVGVKYTEHTNPSYMKKSLNLKLDYVNNGQSIDGYNELNLSNGVWDPSFTREVLAYEIARTYMYMDSVYQGRKIITKKNRKLFDTWDKSDPVDEWECERARRIEKIQGNRIDVVMENC